MRDDEDGMQREEVVYSGKALRIVSNWLKGWPQDEQDGEASPDEDKPRTPGYNSMQGRTWTGCQIPATQEGAEKSLNRKLRSAPGFHARTSQQAADSDLSEELSLCTSSSEEESSRAKALVSKGNQIEAKQPPESKNPVGARDKDALSESMQNEITGNADTTDEELVEIDETETTQIPEEQDGKRKRKKRRRWSQAYYNISGSCGLKRRPQKRRDRRTSHGHCSISKMMKLSGGLTASTAKHRKHGRSTG